MHREDKRTDAKAHEPGRPVGVAQGRAEVRTLPRRPSGQQAGENTSEPIGKIAAGLYGFF